MKKLEKFRDSYYDLLRSRGGGPAFAMFVIFGALFLWLIIALVNNAIHYWFW